MVGQWWPQWRHRIPLVVAHRLATVKRADRILVFEGGQIIFRVDDCRRTHELLSRRGAEFLTPPVDRGGEVRAFFRDPDGHLFEISQLT